MEPSKKNILKWTKALRSGKFKQTKGKLQDEKGYCCLGVACEIFIEDRLKDKDSYLKGTTPYDQKFSPLWLDNINYKFSDKTKGFQLLTLNDDEDFNFDEIADCLELVYIHKILD